jgi:hypothetical protein
MGESKRRAQRGAALKRRFGTVALDLHLFPLESIDLPRSQADLPLAMWKLQIGLETLELRARGKLFCVCCDGPIAVDLPPVVGFLKPDAPRSELCGIAVCVTCFRVAGSPEELTEMVQAAVGGVPAPVSPPN